MKQQLQLTVNGEAYNIFIEPWKTLLQALRDEVNLTGTKEGCQTGSCGTCTVLIDGKAVKSCLILVGQAKGRQITTIEGLAKDGLHPLQQAFIDHFAVQCGFCTPGMILAAKALLDENPAPSEEGVRKGLVGNLCRCTGYTKIVEAVLAAGAEIKK
jgi:aerobic-type carbon monoxide dehydrogenase small subunit (CoxS/CutS family)